MSSLRGYQLSPEIPNFVDTSLRCFAVGLRSKKLKNYNENGGEIVITDLFLAPAGYEVIMNVSTTAYPTSLENLTFEKISQIIKRNMSLRKWLVVAERTKSMSTKLEIDEPIIKY